MPRRPKDPVLASLKTPADWDRYLLKTYGLPQESRSDLEKGESLFGDARAEISITLEEIAASRDGSTGLELLQKETSDRETAVDESIQLSPEWNRYFGVMCVIADAVVPEKDREAAKNAALEQCRLGSAQKDAPPNIPAGLGTPEELRLKWRRRHIEIRVMSPANRQEHVIEIWDCFVPDDPEEEPGDDPGHWEGLKWRRHKPDSGD